MRLATLAWRGLTARRLRTALTASASPWAWPSSPARCWPTRPPARRSSEPRRRSSARPSCGCAPSSRRLRAADRRDPPRRSPGVSKRRAGSRSAGCRSRPSRAGREGLQPAACSASTRGRGAGPHLRPAAGHLPRRRPTDGRAGQRRLGARERPRDRGRAPAQRAPRGVPPHPHRRAAGRAGVGALQQGNVLVVDRTPERGVRRAGAGALRRPGGGRGARGGVEDALDAR